MTMADLSNSYSPGDDIWYLESFRAVFEDHIEYLKGLSNTVTHYVTPEVAYMYRYRPYQYLTEQLQVAKEYHWFVLRLSGLSAPEEFDASIRAMRVPDWTFIRTLASNHQTQWRAQ